MNRDFWFIRHGETDWNKQGVMQGSRDIPLNEKGRIQARDAALNLVDKDIRHIVTSPLSRAYETAEIIQSVIDRPLTIQDSLHECNWGEKEGQPMGDWFWQWKAGDFCPQGSETHDGFLRRAHEAILEALQKDGPILIVAHGGVHWAIAKFMLKIDGATIPNAQAVFYSEDNGIWR